MPTIQLLDVIEYYKGLNHQKKALSYLQTNIPKPILDKFAELWRTAPKDEPKQHRSINQTGLNLIKDFEGCLLTAYDDGVGILTIGYGHTQGVSWGQTITQTQAEELLAQDLKYFEQSVANLVKVTLTDNQFAALVSLAFNIGTGAFAHSTLLRLLNQNQYQAAADQFLRWVNGGGKEIAGLVRRRKAERDLFLT
jgi:GH24 family phage-related lysozyme (muramidase)